MKRMTLRAASALMLCLALLATITGCATGGTEKKSAIASLQTVYIEIVPSKRAVGLVTRTQANTQAMAGAIGGAIGGAFAGAGAGSGVTEAAKFGELVKKEGIQPEQLVAQALRDQLQQRNIVAVTDVREEADAIIRLESNMFVMPTNGVFFGDYGLHVGSQMRITDPSGKQMLKRDANTFGNNELTGASLDEYLNKGDTVRAHTKTAVDIVARVFASQLMVARMK